VQNPAHRLKHGHDVPESGHLHLRQSGRYHGGLLSLQVRIERRIACRWCRNRLIALRSLVVYWGFSLAVTFLRVAAYFNQQNRKIKK